MPPQQPKQLPFIWIKVVPTGHWYSSHVSADQLLQGRIRSVRKQDSKWYVVDIIYGSIKAEHTIDALTDTSADNKFFTLEDAQEAAEARMIQEVIDHKASRKNDIRLQDAYQLMGIKK